MAAADDAKSMALDEEDLAKRKQKAEDMSKLVDDKLPAAAALAKAGNLAGAIDMLLTTEKLTRQVRLLSLCRHKDFFFSNPFFVFVVCRAAMCRRRRGWQWPW